MADYVARARSNYFYVTDREAFESWARTVGGLRIIEDSEGRVGLLETDGYGWPWWTEADEGNPSEEYERNVPREVSRHLAEGSVAVFYEAGSVKLAHITGFAIAIDAAGRTAEVGLDEIYDRLSAAGLTGEATGAML